MTVHPSQCHRSVPHCNFGLWNGHKSQEPVSVTGKKQQRRLDLCKRAPSTLNPSKRDYGSSPHSVPLTRPNKMPYVDQFELDFDGAAVAVPRGTDHPAFTGTPPIHTLPLPFEEHPPVSESPAGRLYPPFDSKPALHKCSSDVKVLRHDTHRDDQFPEISPSPRTRHPRSRVM